MADARAGFRGPCCQTTTVNVVRIFWTRLPYGLNGYGASRAPSPVDRSLRFQLRLHCVQAEAEPINHVNVQLTCLSSSEPTPKKTSSDLDHQTKC